MVFPFAQSSFGFHQQAIKEKVHRVLPRNALHSLTARRHQRSTTLRVSFPVQINLVIIKLASDLFSSFKIADKNGIFEPPEQPLERCVYRPLFTCYVFRAQRSPCPGSAASIASAVPGPTPTVAQSTPRDSVWSLLALLIHV